MFIHVVQKGEALPDIATLYEGTAAQLRAYNALADDHVVDGMAIMIPAGPPMVLRRYQAIESDTLESLARHTQIPEKVLAAVDQRLRTESMYPIGQFWIPSKLLGRPMIELQAIVQTSGSESDLEKIQTVKESITFLTMEGKGHQDLDLQLSMNRLTRESVNNRTGALLGVSKKTFAQSGADEIDRLLSDSSTRSAILGRICEYARTQNYYGMMVDLEPVIKDMDTYRACLRELRHRTQQAGLWLVVTSRSVPDEAGHIDRLADLQLGSEYADRVIISAEAWLWNNRQKGVSAVQVYENLIEQSLSVVPPEKIWFDIPLYAIDLDINREQVRFSGAEEALASAIQREGHLHFDEQLAKATFVYRDEAGTWRRVWFDDCRSMLIRLELVNRYKLRGVSARMLGYQNHSFWQTFLHACQIQKVV